MVVAQVPQTVETHPRRKKPIQPGFGLPGMTGRRLRNPACQLRLVPEPPDGRIVHAEQNSAQARDMEV